MTNSHGHQRINLFEGLVKRARSGQKGMSKGAMALAYDFDDPSQLQDALDSLVSTGHISIDLDGRFPAIRIYKARYKAFNNLSRPLFLSPGRESEKAAPPEVAALPPCVSKMPASDLPFHPPRPALVVRGKDVAPAPVKIDVREQFATVVAKPAPTPILAPPVAPPPYIVESPAPRKAASRSTQVSFHITDADVEWIGETLDGHPDAISYSAFCRELFMAEVDRRRNEASEKHHISAMVMRAAREEGVPLGTFVTRMIEVGMAARDMNRRGI
jgi:hypothetical protein